MSVGLSIRRWQNSTIGGTVQPKPHYAGTCDANPTEGTTP